MRSHKRLFRIIGMHDNPEVIEWMLRNQLGRRNLTDFQRNEVALRYQSVIAEQMKKRQSLAGGDKKSSNVKIASDQMIQSDTKKENTNQRTELAKIAKTSEGSIYRSKQILDKGTPEQIERARKGGKDFCSKMSETKGEKDFFPKKEGRFVSP